MEEVPLIEPTEYYEKMLSEMNPTDRLGHYLAILKALDIMFDEVRAWKFMLEHVYDVEIVDDAQFSELYKQLYEIALTINKTNSKVFKILRKKVVRVDDDNKESLEVFKEDKKGIYT